MSTFNVSCTRTYHVQVEADNAEMAEDVAGQTDMDLFDFDQHFDQWEVTLPREEDAA